MQRIKRIVLTSLVIVFMILISIIIFTDNKSVFAIGNKPIGRLYVDDVIVENNSYTNGNYIRFECDEKCYVKLPNSDVFIDYVSNTEYYKVGRYEFYGINDDGESTGYYTIVIDRTHKQVELQNVTNGNTTGDVVIDWNDENVDVDAPIKNVTINGKVYTKGTTIYTIDTGIYNVKVVDYANNEWNTQFTSTKKNIKTKTLQKQYYEIYDKDGNYYSFSTYESALNFAIARERTYIKNGEWISSFWDTGIAMDFIDSVNAINGQYYIYKKSGNANEDVAYFTLERLNTVIMEYARNGIKSYYYWEKEPAPAQENENLYTYSETKKVLGSFVELGENIGVLLNNDEFTSSIIDIEGKHKLTIYDEWNNFCDYDISIVKTAPQITYAIDSGNKNKVTFDRVYYLKGQVNLSIIDEYDEMAMFTIYDENNEVINNLGVSETQIITESGTYTVVAVNHAGKSQEFKFILSKNAPSIDITDNKENKQLLIDITESIDEESTIQTIEIYKSNDKGKTWKVVEKDDYGTSVGLDNLVYKFRTTGKYKVIISDQFRTGIDAVITKYDYVQKIPEVKIMGIEKGGYTNSKVIFSWKDEIEITITKNGETISFSSGQEIMEDGYYIAAIKNYDGYIETFNFTIDTIKPQIEIVGATNGQTVNNDVSIIIEEENVIAEFFMNGKSQGFYNTGEKITLDGEYRIIFSDKANNKTIVEFTIDKRTKEDANINDKDLETLTQPTEDEKLKSDNVAEINDTNNSSGNNGIIIAGIVGGSLLIVFGVVIFILKKRGIM